MFGSKKTRDTGARAPIKSALPTPPAAAPVKLRRINLDRRFTIVGETGQGSMSHVFRAVDNQSGRVVCLKLQDKKKTAAALQRSHQKGRPSEGEIAQRIIHPNVVRTFDHGITSKGDYYLAMEFIEGVSLRLVRETRNLTIDQKVDILAQAADALAAVHAAGYIHHDYGPKNLLVTSDNQVKLIDFGLSIPNTPEFRRPGNRTGTLHYMAPEVLRREPKDPRMDIFSWGATAFEFLTGKLPIDVQGPDQMTMIRLRMNTPPTKLGEIAPDLPPRLIQIVDKALEPRPANRWPSADTLGEALRSIHEPQLSDDEIVGGLFG